MNFSGLGSGMGGSSLITGAGTMCVWTSAPALLGSGFVGLPLIPSTFAASHLSCVLSRLNAQALTTPSSVPM